MGFTLNDYHFRKMDQAASTAAKVVAAQDWKFQHWVYWYFTTEIGNIMVIWVQFSINDGV